jgi:SAM-dependent methyltransferase
MSKREKGKEPYKTISSVWEGEDSELLAEMLKLYPRRPPELVLDATVNEGRFWKGNTYHVVGLDIDVTHGPDVVGDSGHLPFRSDVFDVVVYDPPHIPNQGFDKTKDFNVRFGLKAKSLAETGYNFSHTYPPFIHEAYRVLRPEGILLCKITDYVHGHRFQWAHVDFLMAATVVGFTACDCIVKIRKGPIIDPKWKKAHHARKRHCYWLVFRKSRKCE